MDNFLHWLHSFDWSRLFPELLGKFFGVLLGLAGSWYLVFRKRVKALEKLKSGDSDDVLFQMHLIHPLAGTSDCVLLFRNIAPRLTINQLYDNPAARELVKQLADGTSMRSPVLQTMGTMGFEILNDALGHIAGQVACMPFPREVWLFAMTCEDRAIVRKKCVRCFLIRPADLERFSDWAWCRDHLRVEKPWHWFRIVALHQMSLEWLAQQQANAAIGEGGANSMPIVNDQEKHDRIRELSIGLGLDDKPVGTPYKIPWAEHLVSLNELGLPLEGGIHAPIDRTAFRHD